LKDFCEIESARFTAIFICVFIFSLLGCASDNNRETGKAIHQIPAQTWFSSSWTMPAIREAFKEYAKILFEKTTYPRIATHDDELVAVDDDRPPDEIGIAAEAALPEGVAHDGRGAAARLLFLGDEPPAERRLDAYHVGKVP
jgi:hypothetical protein